jgi:hypothetical protein
MLIFKSFLPLRFSQAPEGQHVDESAQKQSAEVRSESPERQGLSEADQKKYVDKVVTDAKAMIARLEQKGDQESLARAKSVQTNLNFLIEEMRERGDVMSYAQRLDQRMQSIQNRPAASEKPDSTTIVVPEMVIVAPKPGQAPSQADLRSQELTRQLEALDREHRQQEAQKLQDLPQFPNPDEKKS